MQDALLNHDQQMFDAIDTVITVEWISGIPVVLSKNPLLIKFEVEQDTKHRCKREWEESLKMIM